MRKTTAKNEKAFTEELNEDKAWDAFISRLEEYARGSRLVLSLEDALDALTNLPLTEADELGLDMQELAWETSQKALSSWDSRKEGDDPREPFSQGLEFQMSDGHIMSVTTDYSGVAGEWWQEEYGTYWY